MYLNYGQTAPTRTTTSTPQKANPNTTPLGIMATLIMQEPEVEPVNPTPPQPTGQKQCHPIAGDRYVERFLHKQVNQTLADRDRHTTVHNETQEEAMEVDTNSLKTNSVPEDPSVILEQIEPPRPATPMPEPEDDLPPGEPMDINLTQIWYNLILLFSQHLLSCITF